MIRGMTGLVLLLCASVSQAGPPPPRYRAVVHSGRSRAAVIAEAKETLLAVLSGEQVYYQKFVTFTDAADIADIRVKLGLDLSDASARWAVSVSGASLTGFVAKAEGRDDTKAEGLVVALSYQRGQPLVWTVEKTRGR